MPLTLPRPRDIIGEMSELTPTYKSSGGWLALLAVIGSAVGVLVWHVRANRGLGRFDMTGFDVAQTEAPRKTASTYRVDPAQQSGLSMIRPDAGIRVAGDESSPGPARSGGGKISFADAARRNEDLVRSYSERMTRKYPVIAQYGRDWMRYPDLSKLTNDYARNHDPIAFINGLSRSRSFPLIVRQYAAKPEIREFVVNGLKEAPSELTTAAMSALKDQTASKTLVNTVVSALGLPPSLTAAMSGQQISQADQQRAAQDIMSKAASQEGMNSGDGTLPVLAR